MFVSGKQVNLDSVPITVNGEILLNANELLVKLGVPNDSEHIILDKNKKNLTINYGKAKIKMVTNSNKATVDKSSKMLNSAPIIYKNKLYIPVKSTVQLLELKFAWDEIEKTAYIQNVNEYNKVKTFTYTLKSAPYKMVVEFVPKDKNYYYVLKNKKYSNFIVLKSTFDEPEGLRDAYKKLMAELNKK